MKKSECMCARVCEKHHARKREIETKKANEWNGARERWHEEENDHEGVGKCKCMVAGKAQGHKKECKVVKKKVKVQKNARKRKCAGKRWHMKEKSGTRK